MVTILGLTALAFLGMAFLSSDEGETSELAGDDVADPSNENSDDVLDSFLDMGPPDIHFPMHGSAVWVNGESESYSASDLPQDLGETDFITITDASGSDEVDVSGIKNSIVYSGEGDTVVGSDAAGDEVVFVSISTGGALVVGGDSDGVFMSDGDGDTIMGEGGDDLIIGGNGISCLDGGEGDDTIYSSNESYFVPTGTVSVNHLSDESMDTLSGGMGDDLLYLGDGDEAFGGSGADTFVSLGLEVVLADFEWGLDQLQVPILGVEVLGDASPNMPWAVSEHFSLEQTADGLALTLDNSTIAHLPNSENPSVAFQFNTDAEGVLYSIDGGTPIANASIVITIY